MRLWPGGQSWRGRHGTWSQQCCLEPLRPPPPPPADPCGLFAFQCKWSRKGFLRTRWCLADWYVPHSPCGQPRRPPAGWTGLPGPAMPGPRAWPRGPGRVPALAGGPRGHGQQRSE